MNLIPTTQQLLATPEQRTHRLATCRACDQFKAKPIERCGKCGCPLVSKTKLQRAKCPLDKW